MPICGAVVALLLLTAAECEEGASVFEGDSLPASNTIALINQQRETVGCAALTRDQQLTTAADRHARDMRDNGIRDHTGSDGSTAQSRIADAGFSPASATGEILYWSDQASDYQAAVDWWMNSPTHRAIIEDCTYTHIGIGVYYPGGTRYYTVGDFAAH